MNRVHHPADAHNDSLFHRLPVVITIVSILHNFQFISSSHVPALEVINSVCCNHFLWCGSMVILSVTSVTIQLHWHTYFDNNDTSL